ncbi:hypothetical protein FQZ97_591350 [compost metagenome]
MKASPAICVWLPTPADEKLSFPGLALAYSISSRVFLTGRLALTVITIGPFATLPMRLKSSSEYGSLL